MLDVKLTYKMKSNEPGMDYEYKERFMQMTKIEYECLRSCIGKKVTVKDNGNFWDMRLDKVEEIKYQKQKNQLF